MHTYGVVAVNVPYTDEPVIIKPEFVLCADWLSDVPDLFVQAEVVVCAPNRLPSLTDTPSPPLAIVSCIHLL